MAQAARYRSLGTFEFLVDLDAVSGARRARRGFAFIEANPRLQVEHTVTEEVTGVDLVQAQLALAGGASLEQAGLGSERASRAPRLSRCRRASTWRRWAPTASARPSGGTLTAFEPPSGPGLRTDTFGYAGYRTNPSFDSLLAKLIVHSPSPDFAAAARKTLRALREFRIEGVATNIALLERLLEHPDFAAGRVHTRLARTIRAQHRQQLPRPHAQVDTLHGEHRRPTRPVRLRCAAKLGQDGARQLPVSSSICHDTHAPVPGTQRVVPPITGSR